METKNGRAVLLTKGGEFVNIKNKGYSAGDKINITSNTGRLCAMAASLLVVCAGIGSYFVPAGYVSVDINPSLMMTLNPYNRVIDVQTFNDDARILLSRTDIKGRGAEESVEMLIKASEEIGYINDNNRDVILEVVPGMIKPDMERIHHPNIELTNETADRETLRMAQNIGVSMAKVKAIEEYTEKNGGDIRSNAVKFNDKSAKEMRTIMLDSGHLPNNKMHEIPPQSSAPKEFKDAPKPQTQIKPPHNTNIFPVIEQRSEKPIHDNKPPENDYRPSENVHTQTENNIPQPPPVLNNPPVLNTEPVNNPIKTEQNPQGDKILPNKEINEPVKKEKPQSDSLDRNKPNHGDSGNAEKQPKTTEKKPDDAENKFKEDLTNNSDTDKKPDKSDIPSNNLQINPSEPDTPKNDNNSQNYPQMPEKKPDHSVNQGNPQPSKPKAENNTPPKAESKPQESVPKNNNVLQTGAQSPSKSNHEDNSPQNKQPPQSEPKPQNDSGNNKANESIGGHDEHREMS